MLVFWTIIEIIAAIAVFIAIVGFVLSLVTDEPMIAGIALILLVIGLAGTVIPEIHTTESTEVVTVEITHMDMVRGKSFTTRNMSVVSEDGSIAEVLSVNDVTYASHRVGDTVELNVTRFTTFGGRTGQEVSLITGD